MPLSARAVALETVAAFRKTGAWSADTLNELLSSNECTGKDRSLAARIALGTVQNLILCDYVIDRFLKIAPSKLEPLCRDILRISVYQLTFLSRVPVYAVVNEAISLTKRYIGNRAAGTVNAILRSISASDVFSLIPQSDPIDYLSIRYSQQRWFTEYVLQRLGFEACEACFRLFNVPESYDLQVNTLKTSNAALMNLLHTEGLTVEADPLDEAVLKAEHVGRIDRLESFQSGLYYIQDTAAHWAALAAGAKPGDFVIDGCAAPGGKSFAAAIFMKNDGKILSCDLNASKLKKIEESASRLGISIIETRCADGRVFIPELEEKADLVIADVPCSGFGVLGKKPEIRYKSQSSISGLPDIQSAILDNLSKYVKRGGYLLYSTCTVFEKENEQVAADFLNTHKDFSVEPFVLPAPIGEVSEGMITLWPHIHSTDGFFICKMKRS